MSDIVERLRSSIPDWHGGVTIYGQAADCIESLRQQLSIAEANQLNIEETHKITLREVQRESMRLQTENDNLRQQLAACQAREVKLREALEALNEHTRERCCSLLIVDEALALPQDTTALGQLKAQVAHEAGEVMRERCADYCETLAEYEGADEKEWASRIRALPSLTLEDLK